MITQGPMGRDTSYGAEPIRLNETEVRHGVAPGRLRYMLTASLALTCIGMAVALVVYVR